MRKFIFLMLTLLFTLQIQAQQETIELLRKQLITIETEEKKELKQQIDNINSMLQYGVISTEEANRLKLNAAEARARKIEERQAVIKETINYLEKKGANQKNQDGDWEIFLDVDSYFNGTLEPKFLPSKDSLVLNPSKIEKSAGEVEVRTLTTLDLVAAYGFNNAIEEGNWQELQEDGNYSLYESYFLEIGIALKTPLTQKNRLRLKYGLSYQVNNLKPSDNRYFVEVDDQVQLETGYHFTGSGFAVHNLVLPVHLEFGPTKKKQNGNKAYYSAGNQLKIAVGGYIGLNLSARQLIQRPYFNNGYIWIVTEEMRGYDTNEIYGLSAYVGLGAFSLYGKYDLNTIFRNGATDQRFVSLGLRLDL